MQPLRSNHVAGTATRSKLPSAAQTSLESKLAQLEEIRRKRLELEKLLTGSLPLPERAKPAERAQPLAPNSNVQNLPPLEAAVPVVKTKLENVPFANKLSEIAPAEPVKVAPEPPATVELGAPTALPGTCLAPPPPASFVSDMDETNAPTDLRDASESSSPEIPKPVDFSMLGTAAAGRSNARVRAQTHEQTPYHSRSLRLRALAQSAGPEPSAQQRAKTGAEKGDEWTAATRKNTLANKGHHAKLIITVVHREGPRPPSPSQVLRERNMDFNAEKLAALMEDMAPLSHPLPGQNGKKRVRWTASEIIDEEWARSESLGKASDGSAPKPCIRRAETGPGGVPATISWEPKSPPIVTIQRFVWQEFASSAPQAPPVEAKAPVALGRAKVPIAGTSKTPVKSIGSAGKSVGGGTTARTLGAASKTPIAVQAPKVAPKATGPPARRKK